MTVNIGPGTEFYSPTCHSQNLATHRDSVTDIHFVFFVIFIDV